MQLAFYSFSFSFFQIELEDYYALLYLASRGLDVEHVGRVINYHMPKHLENYLHRAGRTARAGRSGLVINFITDRDQTMLHLLKQTDPSTR